MKVKEPDKASNPHRWRDRGVALVEFALLLPVLAIIVFGTVDLGRAFQLKNELKNAAREGAAYAERFPTRHVDPAGDDNCDGPNNIQYQAQKELDGDGTAFTIEYNDAPLSGCETLAKPAGGTTVTVSATKDFDVFTPFIGAIVGDPITVTETVSVVVLK